MAAAEHDGSASLTNFNASSASNSPGAGASPHTGFSSGMTPTAGTASGTADGTTDTCRHLAFLPQPGQIRRGDERDGLCCLTHPLISVGHKRIGRP